MPGMDTKETRVTCPCCQSRLEIDVRTSTVVRWRRPGELDETGKPVLKESDWGSASERVAKRLVSAAEKLEQGLSKEQSRERDLDELFRKASDKLRKKKDGE
jgi:hypothetical protein